MNKTQTKSKARSLVEMAMLVTDEGEPLDLTDNDFTMEDIVRIKSLISHQRKAIDMVNKALAIYWDEIHHDEIFEEEFTKWSVGTTAGKRIINDTNFYKWLASKNEVELVKLVSATAIKVGGMTPAERDSLLDETPTNMNLTIKNNRRY